MTFPTIFSQLPLGESPFSLFDTMFNVVGSMGTVFCTATGTNTIALTPNTNMPALSSYQNFQAIGFLATTTATGPITLNVNSLGAVSAYAADGSTQLGSGALIINTYYLFVYNSILNTGAGGFQLISVSTGGTAVVASSINGGQLAGLRNRTINGSFAIDQRNSGSLQTITASTSAAYTVDRFYATCTGANVTGQQVVGSGQDQFVYQFVGAPSVTAIAFGQRYESINVYDLQGTTATLSIKLANSLLSTVTWSAYYPTATDNWTSRTLISTGTFTVNPTPTTYTANIALPSNVTAGLEVELTVGPQVSGTWTIGSWQLENGTVATPFERRPVGLELSLCQRYYEFGHGGGVSYLSSGAATQQTPVFFKQDKFVVPNVTTTFISSGGGASSPSSSQTYNDMFTCGFASPGAGATILFSYAASAEL